MKKKLFAFLFIFITRLHNKHQDCGASVASAAGPFSTKKNPKLRNEIFSALKIQFKKYH
jgi:hypothetical protein